MLHRLVLFIELGTVQTGSRKIDPARKFKCTTAALVILVRNIKTRGATMSQSYSSLTHRFHLKSFFLIQSVLYYKVYELYFTRLEYSSQLSTCLYLSRFKGIGCDLFYILEVNSFFQKLDQKISKPLSFFIFYAENLLFATLAIKENK